MTAEQSFDRRIKKFLHEQPNSDASKTILKIEKLYPGFKSYYALFDDFLYKLGLVMNAQIIVNKNYKTIGYIPSIKYYPENLLNEEPRIEKLISELSPLSLESSYEFLAKEILYRIMKVRDLNSIIMNKN
ncbi:hypothetical protein [Litoribacter ruber]|uniref:hypothetical protein n=1 Tax=Litoribacter ruber TaxID=702568 RepID=UPI001BD9CCA0|nr:hypothetical protein [Litoribacter ruber]